MVAACGPAPDVDRSPGEVVRAFFDRYEAGDEEGILALLADGFTFRSGDGSFTLDREAMPSVLAWDFAAGGAAEIEELAVEGDTARVLLRERNRFTELLELEPWLVEASFVVEGGRIRSEVAREVTEAGRPSFTERFERAVAPVAAWAAGARPQEAEAIFEEGRIARYDGPTARGLLRLIEAFRDAGSPGGADP